MDAIAQLAAAMELQQRRLENAAERLANADTDGFRGHVATNAPLRPSGRPFDLVVSGGGTLRVATLRDDGSLGAHEDVTSGSFSLDRTGRLVDARGRALLGANGPIHADAATTVRADGAFVRDGEVTGRVPLANGAELRSGFVAGSDVNSIGEMVRILDAQRQFETAQKTLGAIDAARGKATSEVGKIQ